jgi:hypothetical protein
MQWTLIELGFLPVAYLPALEFHEVERLDIVKMVRLLSPPQVRTDRLTPSCAALAELVLRLFRNRTVLPRIAKGVHDLPLFGGLNAEQFARLAGVRCHPEFGGGIQHGSFFLDDTSCDIFLMPFTPDPSYFPLGHAVAAGCNGSPGTAGRTHQSPPQLLGGP